MRPHHALIHNRIGLATLVERVVARVDVNIVRGLSATDSHNLHVHETSKMRAWLGHQYVRMTYQIGGEKLVMNISLSLR